MHILPVEKCLWVCKPILVINKADRLLSFKPLRWRYWFKSISNSSNIAYIKEVFAAQGTLFWWQKSWTNTHWRQVSFSRGMMADPIQQWISNHEKIKIVLFYFPPDQFASLDVCSVPTTHLVCQSATINTWIVMLGVVIYCRVNIYFPVDRGTVYASS